MQKQKAENYYTNPRDNQNQKLPGAAGSILMPVQRCGRLEKNNYAAVVDGLSKREQVVIIFMLLLGSAMQAYANQAIEAIIVALLLLFVGRMVVTIVFPGKKAEMRAFMLMFAVCIFVGGLAQIYSLVVFDRVQSTVDARGYFWRISPEPPFRTLATVPRSNYPLAIVIWQQAYKVTWWLRLKFGPYTAVMFNSMVMGLVASLTVQIARELFGEDAWRLRRAGTLVAANGMFILFGAIMLRDSFTTFFNTLMLWGLVRWLNQPKPRTLLFAIGSNAVSFWAMRYLREEAILLYAPYVFLVLLVWIGKRMDIKRLIIIVIVSISFLFFSEAYIRPYFQTAQSTQLSELEKYIAWASLNSPEDSLGMRFVINQPIPIRLVLGSITLLIAPIPLWGLFNFSGYDYHWIKGYNGLYQVYILPFVFFGGLTTLRMFRKDREQALPFMFLMIFFLMNLISVAITSRELRHFGQFMVAMVILAILPDNREANTKIELRKISYYWVGVLLIVHLLWAVAKVIL